MSSRQPRHHLCRNHFRHHSQSRLPIIPVVNLTWVYRCIDIIAVSSRKCDRLFNIGRFKTDIFIRYEFVAVLIIVVIAPTIGVDAIIELVVSSGV